MFSDTNYYRIQVFCLFLNKKYIKWPIKCLNKCLLCKWGILMNHSFQHYISIFESKKTDISLSFSLPLSLFLSLFLSPSLSLSFFISLPLSLSLHTSLSVPISICKGEMVKSMAYLTLYSHGPTKLARVYPSSSYS